MSSVGSISAQTLDPNALREVMRNAGGSSAQKINAAATQFEAILVRQFLGDSLKPMIKGALSEDDSAASTYRYFLTDTLSQALARQGVFGVGKQIATQLQSQENRAAAPTKATPSLADPLKASALGVQIGTASATEARKNSTKAKS